jgi:hypothetical protein
MPRALIRRAFVALLAFGLAVSAFAVPAVDDYSTQQTGKGQVFDHAAAVTPSDSADLGHVSRGFIISVDGALKVDTVGGETITFASGTFLVKTVYNLRVKRVYTTGTTATGIVVFW